MLMLIKKFISPMLSLFLVSIGIGALTTAQTVWLNQQHYSSLIIGLVTAAYYAGFLYAAFKTEKMILQISHIRAYSFFAAILCSVIILQGVIQNPWYWIVIRLIAGYCSAGLFVVVESWLLCKSDNQVRGRVLGLYMFFYYLALAISQFLLNMGVEDILRLFSLAAVTTSLSIVPLAFTKVTQPAFNKLSVLNLTKLFKLSPTGTIGCFFAGLVLGPIYGILPLYLADQVIDNGIIAFTMFIVIIGGVVFQIPLGKLSDTIDRRNVLVMVFLFFFFMALLLLFDSSNEFLHYSIFFLLGGAAFSIYPISMSHACDVLEVDDLVSAAQGLVFFNSLGMIVGPLLASLTIFIFHSAMALIGYFITIGISMALFFGWRRKVGVTVAQEEQADFIATPRTTPVGIEIDPRIDSDT
jgi:MFS family permease